MECCGIMLVIIMYVPLRLYSFFSSFTGTASYVQVLYSLVQEVMLA
jgi:hypothetical protein